MSYRCKLDSEIDFENCFFLQSTYVKRWTLNKNEKKKTKKRIIRCEYTVRDLELGDSFESVFIGWTQKIVAIVATKQMLSCTKPSTFSENDGKELGQSNEISEKHIVHF